MKTKFLIIIAFYAFYASSEVNVIFLLENFDRYVTETKVKGVSLNCPSFRFFG